jgi:hypothetical protein
MRAGPWPTLWKRTTSKDIFKNQVDSRRQSRTAILGCSQVAGSEVWFWQFGSDLWHRLTVNRTLDFRGLNRLDGGSEMAKKSVLDSTQKTVVKAAKIGAQGVKDVATDALGAAASAAVGVVLGRVSEALGSGSPKPDEAALTVPQAVGDKTRSRRKPVKKKLTAKKGSTKARAATKRSAVKNRSASKPVKNKKSIKTKGPARKSAKKKNAVRGRRGR